MTHAGSARRGRRLGPAASVACWALAGGGCTEEAIRPAPVEGDGGGGGAPAYGEPYVVPLFDRARINSRDDQENFQNATVEVTFGARPFAQALLVIDLDTTCYPFESWADNPPPPGENWPADCDAYDRNFEWTLDDPREPVEPPGLELVRAITPFGGPRHHEIDITDVLNGIDEGPHRVRVHITTWSDGEGRVSGSNGGWFVSGSVMLTPGPAPRNVLSVQSLFNKSYGPSEEPAPQSFLVPEGAVASRLEYRVTGHGGGVGGLGCVGPAEEFCNREHTFVVDGADYAVFQPWRTDCGNFCTITRYTNPSGGGFDYCLENPCGAIPSVQAPRANWCPGDVSAPFVFEPALTPGEHTVAWDVSAIAAGGSWRTSVTYFAFGAP